MPPGLDSLKHIVVLMMENRSFDHMLGSLKAVDPRIDGLTGDESNPDTTGSAGEGRRRRRSIRASSTPTRTTTSRRSTSRSSTAALRRRCRGFVASYFEQRRDVKHSRKIMYYFKRDKLPVLTTLALEYAVFNRWFASIPGPTLCNRAFAHYGTSFGHVGMELFYANQKFKSIYERLEAAGHTAKIYYFDQKSSTMEIVNLLQNQPQFFGTYDQFLDDCKSGVAARLLLHRAELQRPRQRRRRTCSPPTSTPITTCSRASASSRRSTTRSGRTRRCGRRRRSSSSTTSTAGSTTTCRRPPCTPDGFVAQPTDTGTNKPFLFDRLGVRVPAILVSPWVRRAPSSTAACSSTRRFPRR